MDVWDAVRQERIDLADQLVDLSPEQWDSPSLCPAWRIRDVLAHVTAGAEGRYGIGAIVGGTVRHRFNVNRWLAADGQARGNVDPVVTRTSLKEAAGNRRKPPGVPVVGQLADVVVHGGDIARPLSLHRDIAESHLRPVADFLAKASGFGTKKRITGLRLLATDMEWTYGKGPDVTGPGEALVMFLAGRLAVLDDLSGEGKTTLATRCS